LGKILLFGHHCSFTRLFNRILIFIFQPPKSIGTLRLRSINSFHLSPDAKPFVPQSKAGSSGKENTRDFEEAFCPYYTEIGSCVLNEYGLFLEVT
jgi:hypothetical protein